ncbi:diaminopimelate decarboxylase [Phorcysia thermohydrogeniphila]|uniref:Diaminopimelate decarboxylase n=1 Tax=Phorcysia thermohydrogeniphila TaxID=936138 RepID=A0A4R1GAF6_9BACT|nr:diaminopimelate decarboxylase [Phorcysia thermohydrogeniphila]TCK03435.1 diaminopimelate decarboxylase [Phorcysia thermohydrogeniphila]
MVEEIYPHIYYQNGILEIEGVKAEKLAEEFGTPLYVYSRKALEYWFSEFDGAFKELPHITCFAVKSCSNVHVLKVLKELGAGADTVSVGEIFRALNAGIDPKKIVFAGVGKRPDEIEYALEKGILMFNVESESELYTINRVAENLGKVAPIAFRVNPEVDPKTHPYISTGLKESKFGVTLEEAVDLYRKARELKWLNPIGIHFHIGSQITEPSVFKEAAVKVANLVKELHSLGIEIEFFDAGGGLGINYNPAEPPIPATELAKQIVPIVKELGCKLILEPGRRISGNAGVLLTRIIYKKERENKLFYIVDAGMNDLARPSLYGAYHHIIPATLKVSPTKTADVVGPICETGDILAKDRELPLLEEGEIIAILSAGAYGFTMASNYNSRPRPAEVLVENGKPRLIRQRETLADLIAREF